MPRPEGNAGLSEAMLVLLEQVASTRLTLSGLAQLLVEWVLDTLPIDQCLLVLGDPAKPMLRITGSREAGRVVVRLAHPPASELEGPAVRAIAVLAGEHGLGELRFVPGAPQEWREIEQRTLARLVRPFGFLIHQRLALAHAQEQTMRDELTGLYNRRYLWQTLGRWLPRAQRERRLISLFLFDVDHFKDVNDQWGHRVGDHALVLLGQLMGSLFRKQDVVCRYGGEEFVVLLGDDRSQPAKDHPREVYRFAERLRQAASHLCLTVPDGRELSRITISGGVATFPRDANSAEDLFQRADQALYRAKQTGRNRICLAGPADASRAG